MERWNQQGNCYPRGDMPRGNEWLSKLAREFIKPLNNLQAYPGSEKEREKERHKKKRNPNLHNDFLSRSEGSLNQPSESGTACMKLSSCELFISWWYTVVIFQTEWLVSTADWKVRGADARPQDQSKFTGDGRRIPFGQIYVLLFKLQI